MTTEVVKRLINVDDYYKMAEVGILKPGDRVELINGDIYEMSPIGSKHAGIVNRLAQVLNELFKNEAIIGIQSPVRIDRNNEPEPDIFISKYRSDYYASSHPGPADVLIIMEVADSSIAYDREVKKSLYTSHNIPEYWIIDIENDTIEVYQTPGKDDYLQKKLYHKSDEITLLGKVIQVKDCFPF